MVFQKNWDEGIRAVLLKAVAIDVGRLDCER